jgi:Probable cobalt transporter subunit (CbtB)
MDARHATFARVAWPPIQRRREEAGETPARSRHCDRVANLERHGPADLEGEGSHDPGARTLARREAPTGTHDPEEVRMNEAAAEEPIPLRHLVPWLALAIVLLAVLWLVGMDQGQLSQTGNLAHEFAHDGRHLLGVPCH